MLFIKKTIMKILILTIALLLMVSVGAVGLYTLYPLEYKGDIGQYSQENGIDPYLVASIINVESRFRKDAISGKNARGLMQIGEQTGSWGASELEIENYDVESLFDPQTNIRIGSWYIKKLGKEFDGKLDLILAAYNGGSGNVNKWLKDKEYSSDGLTLDKIPFAETENYLKKVKSNYRVYKKIYKDEDFKDGNFSLLYVDFIYIIKNYIGDMRS